MSTIDAPSTAFITPTKRATFSEAGPSRARPAGASPAYSSRRHSLYGIEDRVVIDPGSRIWKVGFSGESDPRSVFWAQDDPDSEGGGMWDLNFERIPGVHGDRNEGHRLVGVRVVRKLRETFFRHLMTDSKSRKVIVLENTFLPTFVKEHIARALFENLKAPSVSFTPSSLLALTACGRVTGLVVDCGWLETTITPVFHSRPLLHLSHSTPLAGRALHNRLRALLHHHAIYFPPPTSLESSKSRHPANPVPLSMLTDRLVERVLTEGCFVGGLIVNEVEYEAELEVDIVPEESQPPSEIDDMRLMRSLHRRYAPSSTATDLSFKVPPPPGTSREMGFGTLVVPGWVRERAVEVLFADDDLGEVTPLPEALLVGIMQLPVDLRIPLVSSILVTGGTVSLPAFIPRLRISLLRLLLPSPSVDDPAAENVPLHSPAARKLETREWRRRHLEPYKPLYGLAGKLAILNDPSPLDGEGNSAGGGAPRWVPSLMSWVGGSLAGALKTGGPELLREDYDTLCAEGIARAEAHRTALEEAEAEMAALMGLSVEEILPGMATDGLSGKRKRGYNEGPRLGDWSTGVRAG